MSTLFSRRFARTTAELAIRTTAQSAAATLVGLGTGLIDTDWVGVVSTAGMAGLIALIPLLAHASWHAYRELTGVS